MSTEKSDIEIERQIDIYKRDLLPREQKKVKVSYAFAGVGIVAGLIGWANYNSQSWLGILLLVGFALIIMGVIGYFQSRRDIERYKVEIRSCEALLRDRRRRNQG